MRDINKIIIHCSATPADMDIGAEEIREWHMSPPHPFKNIGYHHVIRRDGTLEEGRPIEEAGAHAKGHNFGSIGICLVGGADGEFNFTFAQLQCMIELIKYYRGLYPGAEVLGHRDLPNVRKTCPNFNVRSMIDGHYN